MKVKEEERNTPLLQWTEIKEEKWVMGVIIHHSCLKELFVTWIFNLQSLVINQPSSARDLSCLPVWYHNSLLYGEKKQSKLLNSLKTYILLSRRESTDWKLLNHLIVLPHRNTLMSLY